MRPILTSSNLGTVHDNSEAEAGVDVGFCNVTGKGVLIGTRTETEAVVGVAAGGVTG